MKGFKEFDISIRHSAYSEDNGIEDTNIIDDRQEQFLVDIYDEDGEWYAQTVNEELGPALKHAIYLANPVYAASIYPDYFEWTSEHTVKDIDIKDIK